VAQPGSALAWGARGREFESRHPDQILTLPVFPVKSRGSQDHGFFVFYNALLSTHNCPFHTAFSPFDFNHLSSAQSCRSVSSNKLKKLRSAHRPGAVKPSLGRGIPVDPQTIEINPTHLGGIVVTHL
jgi:hypothetical protein